MQKLPCISCLYLSIIYDTGNVCKRPTKKKFLGLHLAFMVHRIAAYLGLPPRIVFELVAITLLHY